MPSLTPASRSEEATSAAFNNGLISGFLSLIPSSAAVYYAMQNPKFVKSTNWQSRTALTIMPALFAFALTSEHKLEHKMREMASESEYSREVSEWAEKEHEKNKSSIQRMQTNAALEKQLHTMYQQSVENSGVRIVPGDSIGVHHKIMNFWQENPFKILAGVGVPTILYIFSGRQENRQLQQKIMHTRIFGQFTVVSLLLGLMGFKTYMDSMGKFISQKEADVRVEEMKEMRASMLKRIEFDKMMAERRRKMMNNEKSTHVARKTSAKSAKVDIVAIEEA